ncbi:PREDICTED: uncharacterized protein LOC109335519 [Lupinus angustifolius]|uniref:uncharacterized protein LOC109335519 n=1 Tax=Lupinus angustifolius TaxID=3871 RepID=UPI00092EF7CB|nr:PREDICTED: uncharacterized protein LOC109335519 [Lupinus angustifolius]
MAGQITTQNPIQDPGSPYFLHPNENPGVVLVSPILDGRNYHSWARAMTMALDTKNKVEFINGSLPKPPLHDPLSSLWSRCNNLVISWLNKSIDPSILPSILWMETAFEIWKDLRERYHQGDMFRISQLLREIYTVRQGNLSIDAY